mmetsp:Transcript_721/g.1115  ORF Transcript_721/g.1115 Transcript_721/m.1115 type:complete len:218 (-) Transcript_721:2859-3512(-)
MIRRDEKTRHGGLLPRLLATTTTTSHSFEKLLSCGNCRVMHCAQQLIDSRLAEISLCVVETQTLQCHGTLMNAAAAKRGRGIKTTHRRANSVPARSAAANQQRKRRLWRENGGVCGALPRQMQHTSQSGRLWQRQHHPIAPSFDFVECMRRQRRLQLVKIDRTTAIAIRRRKQTLCCAAHTSWLTDIHSFVFDVNIECFQQRFHFTQTKFSIRISIK